ncbi:MAG TPA: L,D-transpeptidase family protein [Hyphomicrobiales bacterium]|nr:L,D-transpeptidase family protein [Hyphomicrobiales bacterium]
MLQGGLGVALAGLFATAARAEGLGPAEWEQRFDASGTARIDRTTVPLLSEQTVTATEAALQQYMALEARGGWQTVPGNETLAIGTRGPIVAQLRQRLQAEGDLVTNIGAPQIYDSYVEGAVRRFQARHGLIVTGAVTPPTYQALNVPCAMRRQELETNIVRLRSVAANPGPRYIMVNIPGAQVEAVENGVVQLRHTAVVGRPDRPSPLLKVKALAINFNPFWTVPASIVRKDLIPRMQDHPDYLAKNHIRIYDPHGNELQADQINWQSDDATHYMFRADPGAVNPLGVVRINIANKDGVYMHDTPEKNLFGEDERFDSSGCVRVQNVRELVDWLLQVNGGWDRSRIDQVIRSGERLDVPLVHPVPVYWVYITAWANPDGVVQFRPDIYDKDGLGQIAALDGAPDAPPQQMVGPDQAQGYGANRSYGAPQSYRGDGSSRSPAYLDNTAVGMPRRLR